MLGPFGFTPLMGMAQNRKLAGVRKLLAEGADVNAQDNFGVTALHQAVRYAFEDEANALQIVEALLDAGADVNAADQDGRTPLLSAVVYNSSRVLELLIARDANVNARDRNGQTALSAIEAAPSLARKRRRVIKILEAAGGKR